MAGLLCRARSPLVTGSTEGAWIHTVIFLQGCAGVNGMCSTRTQGDSAYRSESFGKAGGVYINAILIKAGSINVRNYNLLLPATLASDNMSIGKAL